MRAIIAALTALAMMVAPALAARPTVEVGRLSCDVAGGVGLIIVSSKKMTCVFHRDGYRNEVYHGTIDKLGLDIGFTGRAHIEWLVFAASDVPVHARSLAGTYVGASGEATALVGVGANWLVGGSHRGFALQPISIQAQTGVNLSLAFSGLTLR